MDLLKGKILKKNREQEIAKFWQAKEQEIGEQIRGKDMCEYLGEYNDLKQRAWGLLYFTDNSFYVQIYTQKNWWTTLFGSGQGVTARETIQFQIPWNIVKDIHLPPKKNVFLSIFTAPDYRVNIKYVQDGLKSILVLLIYSRSTREKFLKCFQDYHHIS